MTGGQFSPTTPYRAFSTTSPLGHIEHPFAISELAVTAGASFVARSTVYHTHILDEVIEKAILKRGFAVVEVISNCYTHYGRKNKMASPVEMLLWMKESAVRVEKAKNMTEEELQGKITIGVLVDRDLPVYTLEYEKIRQESKKRYGVA